MAEHGDVAEVYSDSGDEDIVSLGSEEDEDDDVEPFTLPPAAKPTAVDDKRSESPNSTASLDLHEACRRAAAKLGIAWPEVPTETTTSRYEGKRLPKAKSSTRQLLPAFPECLEEATRSWNSPLSAKNPVQGGSALDWADMEEKGFSHLPPVEPLLAAHLHPSQKPTMTSASPTLPSKADCFQSSLTEKGYKAVATSVKALNASSLLLAYQAELQDDMSTAPTPALWDELCVVTDLCLRLHRCAVQASGRAMALMVAQERARWLNLSSLSQKEKAQLRRSGGPKWLIRPGGSHHAETLRGEEERGRSTTTVSTQESATPSPHCTPADVCPSCSSTSVPHPQTSAPTAGRRPRSGQATGAQGGMGQETLRCRCDARRPSCSSCHPGG